MKKDQLVKTITLGTFILLMAGYIVFKTGGLDTFFEGEKDILAPLIKADSTQSTMQVGIHEMGDSDISVPVPPLPTDAYGFKRQPVQIPPPPSETYRDDASQVQIQEPIHVDSFYPDVISISSKSAIMVDQSKWIWKLDSIIGFDSTEAEE